MSRTVRGVSWATLRIVFRDDDGPCHDRSRHPCLPGLRGHRAARAIRMQRVQRRVRCDSFSRTRSSRCAPLRMHPWMRLHVQRLREALASCHHRRRGPGGVHVLRHRAGLRRRAMDRRARARPRRRRSRRPEPRGAEPGSRPLDRRQESPRQDRHRVHVIHEDAEHDDHGRAWNAHALAPHHGEPRPSAVHRVPCSAGGGARTERHLAHALPSLQRRSDLCAAVERERDLRSAARHDRV